MSTRTASVTSPGANGKVLQWSGLLNGDVGNAIQVSDFGDKTVQFRGTFGVGGTIVLQGSNHPTTPAVWETLTDPQGNIISKTASALECVIENPVWIRPSVTAGDGTTDLICEINCLKGYK